MEKERGYKVVAIVALLLAVVAVGIGFAAFSATFTINEETVTVNPSDNLLEANMHFTGVINQFDYFNADAGEKEFEINKGVAKDRTWTGISVGYNMIHDTRVNSFSLMAPIINESNYTAYLTGLSLTSTETNPQGKVVCVADEGTSQELVDAYCKDRLSLFYVITDAESPESVTDQNYLYSYVYENGNFVSQNNPSVIAKLEPNETASVVFDINFDRYGEKNVSFPDGPFKIYIPGIEFDFSTTKPAQTN